MEERRQIVNKYVQAGLPTKVALPMSGFAKSTYYYKSKPGKPGKLPSTHTFNMNGSSISNTEIIQKIELIAGQPFIDYGYDRMTMELNNQGFIINKKKVYRLMKEKHLLYPKKLKANPNRSFVQYTIPPCKAPFETIEMDIKYVFISGENKTAYLLTTIDTFTRIAIDWQLEYRMKSDQVIALVTASIQHVKNKYNTSQYIFRTDNGPQFIAQKLSKAVEELDVTHEFIKPGTPEQNGHIESFHNTITRLVFKQYEFQSIHHAHEILTEFYSVYNNKRIMKAILGKSPLEFLELWKQNKIGIRENGKRIQYFFKEKPDLRAGSSLEDLNKLVIQKYE